MLIEFHCTFPYLIKLYSVMFIIIVFWLGSDRPSGFIFSCPLYFFPYSCFSYIHRRFLYLISLFLFPCASVWENTHQWVPNFLVIPIGIFFFEKRHDRNGRRVSCQKRTIIIMIIIIIIIIITIIISFLLFLCTFVRDGRRHPCRNSIPHHL